jgi:tRNA pseudouridine38-40 synthase
MSKAWILATPASPWGFGSIDRELPALPTDRSGRTTWRLELEYDGAPYGGWQRQPGVQTIQQVVEEALCDLFGGEPIRVIASGRTDAGVHALAQVASFRARTQRRPEQVRSGLNAGLPPQVACLKAEAVHPGFHALADARGKHYRYVLRAGKIRTPLRRQRCWTTGYDLDHRAMRLAMASIVGTHDFSSFRAARCAAQTSVRTIWSASIAPQGDELHIEVHGRGFLRHMVRNLVGSLVDVGRGKRPPAWLGQVLAARSRSAAGRAAPAHGLFLVSVDYDDPPLNG